MMKDRRKITKEVAVRYKRAFKKGKGNILDEFVQLTGYNRYMPRICCIIMGK